jgi:hypothetical protein
MARFSGITKEIVETVINELGSGAQDGGAARQGGASGWSRAILARDMTGEEIYQQMNKSPSTRMLQMANHGTPNDHLPGQDALDQSYEDEQDAKKPTDLGEMVFNAAKKMLTEFPSPRNRKTGLVDPAVKQANKDKMTAARLQKHELWRQANARWLEEPADGEDENDLSAADRELRSKARKDYNSKRKDNPALNWPEPWWTKAPVQSMIDFDHGWSPWPEGIEQLAGAPFEDKKKSKGDGEDWMLAVLGEHATKSKDKGVDIDLATDVILDSHQIIVGANNSKGIPAGQYEVKKITATDNAFVGAKGNEYAEKVLGDFKEVIRELHSFFGNMHSETKTELKATGFEHIERVQEFMGTEAPYSILNGGHLGKGNVKKMYDATMLVNAYIKNMKQRTFRVTANLAASTSKDGVSSPEVADGDDWDMDTLLMINRERVRQGKPLYLARIYAAAQTIEIARSHLRSHFFYDPEKMWTSLIEIAKPSQVFGNVKGVIIVDKVKGFKIIFLNEIDKYIEFPEISKGVLKMRLTRHEAQRDMFRSKKSEPAKQAPAPETKPAQPVPQQLKLGNVA